jgi:L-ribulose-5-phosphate 3-epimerase
MVDYRLGLYEKAMPNDLVFPEKLREAKRAGYDFMEISIDESEGKLSRLKWSLRERQAIVETMLEIGIRVETLCLSAHRKYPIGSLDEATVRRGMEILHDVVFLAVDLGIRIIQLAGYDVYYTASSNDTRNRFLENLRLGVELAASHGIILAFETMETDFMNTVSKALAIVRSIDSPFLQIYPDIGNITNSARALGQNPSADLNTGRGRIVAVHLKETSPGRFREVPYGEGHVDFRQCISEALDEGVRLFVAEYWYDGQDDWRRKNDRCREFLEAKFIQAMDGRE